MSNHEFSDTRYDNMTYRRCGRSGLTLPPVSLGYWQRLGEAGNEDLCREVTYYAFDHGITHLDFANNYGTPFGHSEEVMGGILKDMPRDELIISTKAGYDMWPGPYGNFGSKKYLVASLDQSLQRLGLDYVDIFYHHRPDFDTPLEETLGALDLIVKQGKALYAGVSSYPGAWFNKAVGVIEKHDWAPITIHQPQYSMLDRWVERDLLGHLESAGCGCIAFSPLSRGLLTDKYLDGLPENSRLGKDHYDRLVEKGTIDKLRKLNEVAKHRGQSLAQMALTWLLKDDRMTSVLIGVSSVEQLAENIAAAQAPPLTDEELDTIDDILDVPRRRRR